MSGEPAKQNSPEKVLSSAQDHGHGVISATPWLNSRCYGAFSLPL